MTSAAPSGASTPADDRSVRQVTLAIASAVATGSMAFNLWGPFLPLFMLQIGAASEAEALFWIAVATSAQGVARLVAGPVWGVLADRVGRKLMLLRTLYCASITFFMTGLIGDPWQLTLAFTFQGIFSGFTPAAVALTSVSVPDSHLGRSLSLITGAQYLGNTVGPAIGSVLAIAFGYRGAILVGAVLPTLAGIWVLFAVPRDEAPGMTRSRTGSDGAPAKLEPFHLTLQFGLAVFLYFVIFTLVQLIRLISPIAIQDINPAGVDTAVGITFTLGGLASAVSLLAIAPRFFQAGSMRSALVASSCVTGVSLLLLALAGSVPLYIVLFALFSLVQAAMIPAANTLIAGNASRARRGTAFGIAGSAQAIAFMVGPFAAAAFVAISISAGFVLLGLILFGLAALLWAYLREPDLYRA